MSTWFGRRYGGTSAPTTPALLLTERAHWGLALGRAGAGELSVERDVGEELRVASIAKLLLLAATAHAIEAGELDPAHPLDRRSVGAVGDSGIWQHLDQQTLSVHDAATLVGMASDNLATNVLIESIGLDRVRSTAVELGVREVYLHDIVRDHRGPEHPRTLGSATARGLFDLFGGIAAGTLGDARISARMRGWLSKSLDLSMVASALRLDPLAHCDGAGGVRVVNKTGTDAGVRADAGFVETPSGTVVYCAIANWNGDASVTAEAMDGMRSVGEAVLRSV
ncbi:beta-lactamase class A [Agrococcus sp. UYP33]